MGVKSPVRARSRFGNGRESRSLLNGRAARSSWVGAVRAGGVVGGTIKLTFGGAAELIFLLFQCPAELPAVAAATSEAPAAAAATFALLRADMIWASPAAFFIADSFAAAARASWRTLLASLSS